MSKPPDYSWMRAYAEQWLRQNRAAEAAKRPPLTLVTPDFKIPKTTRKPKMTKPPMKTTPAIPCEKTEPATIFNEAIISASPGQTIVDHGAFKDLYSTTRLLDLGADALKGIAAMMLPGTIAADEQMCHTNRSDLYAIFQFFGEVLKEPAQQAGEAIERLQRAAQEETV